MKKIPTFMHARQMRLCLPVGFPFRTDFSPCCKPHAVITSVNTHFSAYKDKEI